MLNFCTLFDSNYLSRGLAMYYSLKQHCKNFHLFVFAFNDLSYKILKDLNLQNLTVISLKEFESPDLLKVKPTRTTAEYCWTSTPSTIDFVLNNFNVDNCTYIDADLIFYQNPEILIKELNKDKNIIITEHRYAKTTNLYEQNRAGRFCVQFVTFTKDEDSKMVLKTWQNQCLDWCFARYEDGKFGDQKYLDIWPEKYPNVHIMEHLGGGLAPWNVNNYKFNFENNQLKGIDKKNGTPFNPIFYHFHFVRFYNDNTIDIGWHVIPTLVKNKIYKPFINELLQIESDLKNKYPEYKPYFYKKNLSDIKEIVKHWFKKVTKYNLIKL